LRKVAYLAKTISLGNKPADPGSKFVAID